MVIELIQSSLTAKNLDNLKSEIQDLYLSQDNPWIVGYSGGKDSTVTLQLVWNAIADLRPDQRTKRIYVLSSDTLVETPVIVDYIDSTLQKINESAKLQEMPIEANKVVPKLEDTFWVNLIGKGYPAPYNRFRWCTDRLKIKPANSFILDKISEYGEVIVVLGVRSSESATRAQSLSLRKIEDNILMQHSTLPNAFVYAPIKDFSVQDVWSYLLNVKSPWGNDNRDLVAMYQDAQSGECPLVVDTTTPSCGTSRFGCWVCTVVQKDHSMEALIDNGEDWLEPLLNLRDFLSSTKEPENKIKYRSHKRRGGKISFKSDGNIARGPYTLEFCKEALGMLLSAEEEVNKEKQGEDITLISDAELHQIRHLWKSERQDWEDSVPSLVNRFSNRNIIWPIDDTPQFTKTDKDILKDICEEEQVSTDLLAKLIDTEKDFSGLARRSGIFDRLENILSEEWASEKEIIETTSAEY